MSQYVSPKGRWRRPDECALIQKNPTSDTNRSTYLPIRSTKKPPHIIHTARNERRNFSQRIVRAPFQFPPAPVPIHHIHKTAKWTQRNKIHTQHRTSPIEALHAQKGKRRHDNGSDNAETKQTRTPPQHTTHRGAQFYTKIRKGEYPHHALPLPETRYPEDGR